METRFKEAYRMIRDKRKSPTYFASYISYQKERIAKKTEKLFDANDEAKEDRICKSLNQFKMDLLAAEFSAGYEKEQLSSDLRSAINTIIKLKKPDYETMINAMALAVLLNERDAVLELDDAHGGMIKNDRILNCFYSFLACGKRVWDGCFTVPDIYDRLNTLENSLDKESVLLLYLQTWYDDRKSCSWYESDKGNNDTYVGYWSFETAALAKVFNLDEKRLTLSEYYPVL